jgi:fused signal recognition particle receptor
MAFGFIKKVFSFGRKDEQPAPAPAVEETLPAPVQPDVPEFLKRDDFHAQSDAAAMVESPADPVPVSPAEAAPEARAEPLPEPAPVPEAQPVPEPEPVSEAPAPIPEPELTPEPEALAPPPVAIPEPTPEPLPETLPPVTEAPPAAEAVVPVELPEPEPAPAIPETVSEPEPEPVQPPAPELPAFLAAPPATPIAPPAPATPVAPVAGKVLVGKAIEAKREEVAPVVEERKSWFQRLREGLSRSSRELTGGIAGIFTKRKLDEETLEELEEVLLRADLGMETAIRVTDALSSSRYGKDVSDTEVRAIMAQEIEKVLRHVAVPLELDLSHKPHVILVVGVNGTGKTTTIGKLAAKLTSGGLSVMLAAGDTFRAAAIEQLKIWGERTGSPVVSSKIGADAAGLAWDAFEKAKAAGSDVLIIDTAGRLQNRTELMAELEKIVRVLGKHDPEAPHTVLQTVDATTGQNALSQVEIFRNIAGVNGLVMTKLDGTARGGILVAIAAKHKLPVYFIGVGEQVDDLEPFSASDFAKAIAGVS